MQSIYDKELQLKSELWKTYGFSIKYVGTGKAKGKLKKPLNGIYDRNLLLSNSANLGNAPMTDIAKQALNKTADTLIDGAGNIVSKLADKLPKKFRWLSAIIKGGTQIAKSSAKEMKNFYMQGQSLNQSIQVWQSGTGKPTFDIEAYFIPGFFGFDSYRYLEEFAVYSTMGHTTKAGSIDTHGFLPLQPNVYDPKQAYKGPMVNLDKDLFGLEIKGLISIPGGLFIKSFQRDYSLEKDENGVPIFCKANISLEYYRELSDEEYLKFISLK